MILRIYLRQRFCDHAVYIEDLKRLSPDQVVAPCHRCGKQLSACYGLALPATLTQKPKEPNVTHEAEKLAEEASRRAPPAGESWRRDRRPHHTMFIVASEDIRAGQVIYLDAVSDGSYNAKVRPIG